MDYLEVSPRNDNSNPSHSKSSIARWNAGFEQYGDDDVGLEVHTLSHRKFQFTTAQLNQKLPSAPQLFHQTSLMQNCKRNGIDATSRNGDCKVTYFWLLKHLFPEMPALPSLNIPVMDSIFYTSDGSMCYICTDGRRGLIKTKCKNYNEIFLKRKAEIDASFDSQGVDYTNGFMKHLNYVALLRYNNETFIRLKQAEFKSIFLRPVQANEKYKFVGNAQYLQVLPLELNLKQGSLHQLQFDLNEHEQTELFQKAIQKHSQETSFTQSGSSQAIKQSLKEKSPQSYMQYIIFQIYAYINIHYHKHLIFGIFEFMEVSGEYYLSNARDCRLQENAMIQSEYCKSTLISQTIPDSLLGYDDSLQTGGIYDVMESIFDQENHKICSKAREFVKLKFEDVKNQPDVQQSSTIFQSINRTLKATFHEVLNNEGMYTRLLKSKNQELDGSSPLTSISNIARKKHDLHFRSTYSTTKQLKSTQPQTIVSDKFKTLHQKFAIKPKTKWFKHQFNSRKA